MPKVLWVALPLLVAAVLLALHVLRRGAASRHTLNVLSSVLLLGYLATTAGLGIFWVANQQLPVFDWHYLFGYATLLLVALHLVFNFGVVWSFLTRQRGAARAASMATDATLGRRFTVGALGVLVATGAAFVLGLRHGRSELRIEAPAPGGAADTAGAQNRAAAALALVESFHAFSAHSRSGVLLRAPSVHWGDPPPSFKPASGTLRAALPPPDTVPGARFDLAALAALFWHTAGVTATRAPIKLRAAPSSGALFSTELYVAARDVPGLAPGSWRYDAQAHALERIDGTLADGVRADIALGAPGDAVLRDAAAVIIATAVFRRTGQKYRDRTYRYVLADLGHALENLRVGAGAVGAQAHFVARFDESRAAATLRVDEREEGVLALVAVWPGSAVPEAAAVASPSRAPRAELQQLVSASLTSADAPLGVTGAMHQATSLRTTRLAPLPHVASAASPPAATAPESIPLPPAAPAPHEVLGVIAARRSVRRFAKLPITLAALSGVLAAMVGRGASPILSAAVRVNVVVHAVAGLQPGVYRFDANRHALLPSRASAQQGVEGELRSASQAAALDQDVIGDAAVVFVLSIARAVFSADPVGPARGYRHAFIEAGLIGERVYLEAGVRGLGACAVGAFYDEDAAALVGVDPAREWVVHFAALGVPSR